MTDRSPDADLHFWFDPVCPFAWMTSRWVRLVAAQRAYAVQWRPISLRLLNRHVDYDSRFPPEYEAGHTAGLRLLRVVARTRAEHGPDAVGPLYEALGARIFMGTAPTSSVPGRLDRGELLPDALAEAGLPAGLAAALEDASWDDELQRETDAALALTGKDVGTPVLHFSPPEGVAFFGPVISRLPDEAEAVRLWDHVIGLASFPGFAELKRSLRELPQLPALGVRSDEVGVQEDWHGGSRRQQR
jgi:2-hydroxychromene-2-carboxylate isomerase